MNRSTDFFTEIYNNIDCDMEIKLSFKLIKVMFNLEKE